MRLPFALFGLATVLLMASCGLSEKTPGFCASDVECPSGTRCKLDSPKKNSCVAKTDAATDGPDADGSPADGNVDSDSRVDTKPPDVPASCTAASCGVAAPICDPASKMCRACSGGAECSTLNAATPACVGGKCVACGVNSDCKVAGQPICDPGSNACRGCGSGAECVALSGTAPVCLPTGKCAECAASANCGAASKPICDTGANVCKACGSGAECTAKNAATPACAPSGTCVECVGNGDCKMGAKPICNMAMNTCRACQADSDCPADPGVCMSDGHCAAAGEVIFVEFNASGCPGADGSSAKAYCAPNDGVAALTSGRHVIVIKGSVGDRMTVNTTGVSPMIIGRKNAAAVDGSIPATAATAIAVSSDNVLIRDLIVNVGTMPTSKGIVASGAATKLTLLRVTASLGTGLGVDAEAGASLTMDRCLVQNNSVGGILVNGASYDIQNTIVAGNGYGVKFTASAVSMGSQARFNTVAGNSGNAITCDPSNAQASSASIVSGLNDSCTVTNSITTAPTFSATKPYHLTVHVACPAAPATFPDHDFDGDRRAAPIDCGADQFVP